MFTFDLLIPWLSLAAVLFPLFFIQRWIQQHLFGMGFLLAKEKHAATLMFYLFLLPGVFLHEFSHYMMAGVFGVRPKHFTFFPEAQDDGSLEMGFVELEEVKNPVHAAFIGIAPLITGMLVVVWVSTNRLNLPAFFTLLQLSTDLDHLGQAFSYLLRQPDFLLWTYILFAVANSMMPSAEDRRGWWIVAGTVIAGLVALTLLGFDKVVVNWLQGPIASALSSLSAVFGTVLILDIIAAGVIWSIEKVTERATGNKVAYRPGLLATATTNAVAKSSNLRSVYDLHLPLPAAPGKTVAKAGASRLPPGERPAVPTGQFGKTGIPAKTGASASALQAPRLGATNPAPKPVSGPPALARPGTPVAATSTSAQPGNAPSATPGTARPRFGSAADDDYIDADVIDEEPDDDINQEPDDSDEDEK